MFDQKFVFHKINSLFLGFSVNGALPELVWRNVLSPDLTVLKPKILIRKNVLFTPKNILICEILVSFVVTSVGCSLYLLENEGYSGIKTRNRLRFVIRLTNNSHCNLSFPFFIFLSDLINFFLEFTNLKFNLALSIPYQTIVK